MHSMDHVKGIVRGTLGIQYTRYLTVMGGHLSMAEKCFVGTHTHAQTHTHSKQMNTAPGTIVSNPSALSMFVPEYNHNAIFVFAKNSQGQVSCRLEILVCCGN